MLYNKILLAFYFCTFSLFISCNSVSQNEIHERKVIDSLDLCFWTDLDINPAIALTNARWVINESRKIKYLKGEAEGLAGVAIVLENKGEYDSALQYNLLALNARILNKDRKGEATSYVNLARNYSKLHQIKQQWKYLSKALITIKATTDTSELINILNEMAIYYTNREFFDSAKIKFKESLNLAILLKDQSKLVYQLENYGNILNQLYQNDSALYYYNLCVPIYKSNSNNRNLASLYNNIALIFWDTGKRDSAIYYLEKGYNETLKYGNKQELQNYLSNMIDYWEEEPDLKKSNAYLHELVNLKDSVFKNNLEENIANIEKDYTVKLKNEENEKLKSEIKRKNTIRNAAVITAVLIILLAFYQLRIYRQKRNIAEQEKQLKENEIDQLLQERELKNMDALLEGRETERKRIGRDLHDRLGSILSTVKLHFSAIDDRLDSLKKENQLQYQKASALLDEAVGEVRKIAQDLVSGVLVKYGLTAALSDMKNTLEATGKIKINLFEAGTGDRQNLEFEIAIYRIVQELMSNILKHAEATKADIHITKDSNQFTLIVEDNGKGFDPENPEKFGMGMANIKQRVAALGGVVSFDSKPGAGATVIIEIELEEKENDL